MASINEDREILLNGKLIKIATLRGVFVQNFNEISTFLLQLDTGILNKLDVIDLFINFGLRDKNKAIILLFESKKV